MTKARQSFHSEQSGRETQRPFAEVAQEFGGKAEIWSHSEQFASYVPNEETSVSDHLEKSEQGRQGPS